MKKTIIGLICEYNPFHNGHKYHIEQIKKRYPNSLLIAVISGPFTLKGDLSIIDKFEKTKIALEHNVDLIIEITPCFILNGADYFANKAIEILTKLEVELIIFGSELNDIKQLEQLENKVDLDNFNYFLKKNNYSYPKTISYFLKQNLKSNDILGFCYIKAVKNQNSNIRFETIKRIETDNIISATKIRKLISEQKRIENYIPISLKQNIDIDLFWNIFKYLILTTNKNENQFDFHLFQRTKKYISIYEDFNALIEKLITKNYTRSHIKRFIIRELFQIDSIDDKKETDKYRILGLNNEGKNYLNNKNYFLANFDSSYFSEDLKISNILSIFYKDQNKLEIKTNIIFKK